MFMQKLTWLGGDLAIVKKLVLLHRKDQVGLEKETAIDSNTVDCARLPFSFFHFVDSVS